MWREEIYDNNEGVFYTYVKNITQKPILITNIIKKLASRISNYKQFVFTDIGAGYGVITIPVIDYLKDKTTLKCHCLEPSKLISQIKENCKFDNVTYYKEKIEEFNIPNSDFILFSHVLTNIKNHLPIVDKTYDSLNKKGFALMVTTNKDSDDVKLKVKLRKNEDKVRKLTFTDSILNHLKGKKISYEHEIIHSKMDYSGCLELTKEGKDMLAFFYKKPFVKINKAEIKAFQVALRELSSSGKIIKKEDYIWIYQT